MRVSKYSRVLLKEAKKRGITTEAIGDNGKMFLLRKGKKFTYIYQSLTELTSSPFYTISANKYLTNLFLRRAGFPVADFKLVSNFKEGEAFLKKHKKIVIKPLSNNQGKGITIGIKTKIDLKRAIDFALANTRQDKIQKTYNKSVLAEKAVPGDDHRILVIDFEKVFAIKKIPAYVVGDGEKTIAQLIVEKNAKKKRHKKLIVVDESLRHVLERQDLNLRCVPEKGRQVFVRRTANLATGGETRDITDELNPKIKKMAIEAAKALKMPVAGFDFMSRDHRDDKGYFIEVNPIPGLLMHHFPHHGQWRNPAGEIIEMLLRRHVL